MEDTIRFGKVSNIDYAAGKMEIAYEDREDSVTDMLGMLSNPGIPDAKSRRCCCSNP